MVDAYLLVLRLKHDLQTWGSSTHWGLVYMSPSAIKKNIHHTGSSPVLTTKNADGNIEECNASNSAG
jgi:hypothetical protein